MTDQVDDTKEDDSGDDDALLKEIKERFEADLDYYAEEYARGEDDLKFVFGEQWPEEIKAKRKREDRICLTDNRCLPFVHQVVNDFRQARPAIRVSPADSEADIETADVLKGTVRNIEVTSNAETAYDTGVFYAVTTGYGWARINADYADDGSFDKDITIDRVLNWQSVIPDCNHKNMDGSDMEHCTVYDDIPTDKFKEMYPEAAEVPVDAGSQWNTGDTIRIAEQFYKEYEDKTLVQLADNTICLLEDAPEGVAVVNKRTVRVPVIKWCKFSGAEILEKTEWEGKYIPIVPFYGEEVWVDGKRQVHSLIRQARDPQMMLNFWKTASTEVTALQPRVPFIGAVGQFKSKMKQWMTANTANHAYLEYDPVSYGDHLVPAPQRQAPPQGSGTMLQEAMLAADSIKSALGIYDASLGKQSNETSGKAIVARQQEGDNATFHFSDNASVSMRHIGKIIVDLIPKYYKGPRIQRIIGDDGEEKNVPINQPHVKTDQGLAPALPGQQPTGIYDLNVGKYDVVVDVGPSYATKRQEMVEVMLEVAKVYPPIMEAAPDIFLSNLDVPQSKELAKRIKAMMNPALLGDDPMAEKLNQATQGLQQMEQQLMQMAAQLQAKQETSAQSQAIEAAKAEADIEYKKAQTAKIMAEVAAAVPADPKVIDGIVEAIQELHGNLADVGGAVDAILSVAEEQAPVAP
jgi:hypothetical protein